MARWNARLVFVLIITVLSVTGFAQSGDQLRKEDHEALRLLRTQVMEALNRRDMKALRACLAKEFVFTGVDQTVVTNEEQLVAYDKAMLGGADAILKGIIVNPSATVLTRFIGNDVGYTYGVSDDSYILLDGTVVKMPCQWTATLIKEDGQWKIGAAHAGANILKNPVLGKVESFGIKLGIGGLTIGLVVGFLLSFLVRKARKA